MANLSTEQRFTVKFQIQRPKVGTHAWLCSLGQYLLSTYSVPDTVLGSTNIAVNKTTPHRAQILEGRMGMSRHKHYYKKRKRNQPAEPARDTSREEN